MDKALYDAIFDQPDVGTVNYDVSAQLPSGGFVGAFYQPDGSQPQHPSNNTKQPFSGPNSQDRDLRSVLATMAVLFAASIIYFRGWTAIASIMAGYGVFGLLLRIDIWSLVTKFLQ
jgi:hypothetical protein